MMVIIADLLKTFTCTLDLSKTFDQLKPIHSSVINPMLFPMRRKALICMTDISFQKRTEVMIKSFIKYNPNYDIFVFTYGDFQFPSIPDAEVIRIDSDEKYIHDERCNFNIYEQIESCRSKAVLELFSKGYDEVYYSDSDMHYYGKLPSFSADCVVLTPHLINQKMELKNFSDYVISGFCNGGIYNIPNSQENREFFKMMDELTSRKIVGVNTNFNSKGMWQQILLDRIPWVLKNYEISNHNGLNVAYWNLDERNLRFVNGKYKCNHDDLICFHFSGIEKDHPEKLTKYSKMLMKDQNESVKHIFDEYRSLIF